MNIDKSKMQEAISNKTIFWGMVTRLGRLEDKTPYMMVPIAEFESNGVIPMNEVDAEIERKSLVPLLGRNIPFVILSIEEDGTIKCSRREAQLQIKASMLKDIGKNTVMRGEVVREADYGVYVEVNGVSGLLKNNDYIDAAVPVKDFLQMGKKVDVICKSINANGKIQWEPAQKPEVEAIHYDVEEDTCVMGTVINLKPFESGGVGVFVRIGQGLDALCLLPPDMELEPHDKVSLKIISVTPAKNGGAHPPRVRGKLLRVL